MREVYQNYNKALVKADQQREFICKNYSWEKAVDNVYNQIIK